MKHRPEIYARAFVELLNDHPRKGGGLIAGLKRAVFQDGDTKRWDKIVPAIEQIILKKEGRSKVIIQSARPVDASILKKIKEQFENKTVFEQKIQSELLAGVRIVINEEQMIDASLKRKLRMLFENS